MDYNFINQAKIETSILCKYDTCNGYASDFSHNGNFDGWNQPSGLHTYGVWCNFLFSTLIGTSGYIGRSNVFVSVPAEDFYTVKIAMKFHPAERALKPLPTLCKLMWRTLAAASWSGDRSMEFTLYPDNNWHEYVLNMGEHSHWLGDINDLRFYPTIDGQGDDEFFIRSIKITSVSTYRCLNGSCDYHNRYEHPCQGAGQRAFCKSAQHDSGYFDIQDASEIIININNYGDEIIKLKAIENGSGQYVATKLASEISKVGIGGYSEVSVVYNDNRFIIYSGTITDDSSVIVKDGDFSRQLKFFDDNGSIFNSSNGKTPASGFKPASSFHISTFRLLELFDNDLTTELRFDPFGYAIEGGRSDWVDNGVGFGTIAKGAGTGREPYGGIPLPNRLNRFYPKLNGAGKTLIDFTHPFNASGRIKKLFIACTLDIGFEKIPGSWYEAWENEEGRLELSGAKVKIFRPKRDGSLQTIFSANIVNRNRSGGALYSEHQETTEIDCDVWVNKGDLIGVYNVNLYLGKTLDDNTVDAMYFSVNGEATGLFNPGLVLGDGVSGLMLYARSDYQQSCLSINADLGTRTSVSSINVVGETESINLEYNIASCQDINWQVDLFNGEHKCKYLKHYPSEGGPTWTSVTLQNIAYGTSLLSNNIKYNLDGKAADSFTQSSSGGVIPTNPKYFYVNGDGEWLGIHHLVLRSSLNDHYDQHVIEFEEDPIAFDLFFPYNKSKTIYKSIVYFKELNNFRNFSLSTYNGPYDTTGDAEDPLFKYIPEYLAITLDGKRTEKDSSGYDSLKDYLFENPTNILPEEIKTGGPVDWGDGIVVNYYEVTNNAEYLQAANTDWQTITHEFEPVKCYGFRIYCDLHKSTKINEMEVYGVSEELSTSLIGGTTIKYSFYSDIWWNVELNETDDGSVEAYVGDTPRYITIELNPVTSSIFKDINLFVDTDSVYVGEKGCEHEVLIDNSKINTDNEATVVDIKNVYGGNYDLYVDIATDDKKESGLVYHSVMNNAESISNPEVGPDGRYTKQNDYPLVNVNGNVAINCDCWGLKNLIDQKKVYYSYTDGFNWINYSIAEAGKNLNFGNMKGYRSTVINLPTLIRDRYWKFSWDSDEFSVKVYEARAYKDGKLIDVIMYENVGSGPMTDIATYLQDGDLTSGYFTMGLNNSLGIDLGISDHIDSLVLIHDDTTINPDSYPIINGSFTANDIYTRLNIRGIDGQIKDYSYYEYDILTTGSGISLGQGKFDVGTSNTTGVKFNGYDDSYVSIASNVDLVLKSHMFSIDFFVNFDVLPASGTVSVLAGNWGGDAPDRSFDETFTNSTKSWLILVRNTGSSCHFEFWVTMWTCHDTYYHWWAWIAHGLWIDSINVVINKHYHIGLAREDYDRSATISAYVDGIFKGYVNTYTYGYATMFSNTKLPIVIGKGFNGVITEFRYTLSTDDGKYAGANPGQKYLSSQYWRQHQRLFKINIETSADNSFYSDFGSVDTMFDTDYYHYIDGSRFNSLYDTRLIIDLEKRHDLQLLRSYGASDAFSVSLDHFNSSYSSEDKSSPELIDFGRELSYDDVTNSFVGSDYSDINTDLWKIGNVGNNPQSKIYIKNNMLYMKNAENTPTVMWLESKFIIKGYHDIQLDYILDEYSDSSSWHIQLYIINSSQSWWLWVQRVRGDNDNLYATSNTYAHYGGSFETNETAGSMRFKRGTSSYGSNAFSATDDKYWRLLTNSDIINRGPDPPEDFKVRLYIEIGDNCPTTSAFLNLKVNYAGGIYLSQVGSNHNDARWVQVRIPNDETRYVRKLGIYPDLTKQLGLSGGYYNCEWDFLGEAVTNYSEGINIALGATVSGSSVFSSMPLVNLTDGKVGSDFYNAWGSDQTGNPELNINLGEIYSIYRIKIYHGYDVDDNKFLVKDYTISYSADDITYTNIFNISGNTSFERTHDLTSPIDARYVKITITSFDAGVVILRETDGSLQTFEGAVVREIEVNKYYGYSVINSEEYPIIAVNMKDQFYLNSHSLIGIDSEDTSTDWSNNESNFSYSDQIWDDPSKITFSSWGDGLGFNQWVALKRDTATNYNSGPDYLKHLVMSSNTLYNFCDNPWWWSSNLSVLSRDFSQPVEYGISALKIEYSASSGLDIVSYEELEGFGIDQNAAWRDGLAFRFRIDDVDNIDFSEGYFYLAGKDGTSEENDVEYRWNLNTISGAISTGWSSLILPFKYADEMVYVDPVDADEYDPRIPGNILFNSLGLMFKGKDKALTLHLDGFEIRRCHFNEYSTFDKGIYLVKDDFIYTPMGEFNPSYGTIEFWLRPDYSIIGKDFYNVIKTRSLFHFANNQNDVFGAAFTTNGLEVYRGNVTKGTVVSSFVSYIGVNLMDQLIHLAFVYSNNGKKIDSDGSTLRVYMNNVLVAKSFDVWSIQDKKHFNFIFGGNSPIGLRMGEVIQSSSVDGVVSNFKIYNYCKTDFSDALENSEEENVNSLFKTSELIEISKNNLTFFKVGSPNLPLLYEEVPFGDSIKVYVRTVIPKGLTGKEKRTPNLIVSWNVAV